MNLRILKKLSKRAAPLLAGMGDTREQFPAARYDSYIGRLIFDRSDWERNPCHCDHQPFNWSGHRQGMPIKVMARAGHAYVMQPPNHPRKGTPMIGGVGGGEEPEWNEESCWEALVQQVHWHFTTWDGEDFVPTRAFNSIADYLAGAAELIASRARRLVR